MVATTLMHASTPFQSVFYFIFIKETVEEATVSHDTVTLFLYLLNFLGIMWKSIFCIGVFFNFLPSKNLLVINHKTLRFYGLEK